MTPNTKTNIKTPKVLYQNTPNDSPSSLPASLASAEACTAGAAFASGTGAGVVGSTWPAGSEPKPNGSVR